MTKYHVPTIREGVTYEYARSTNQLIQKIADTDGICTKINAPPLVGGDIVLGRTISFTLKCIELRNLTIVLIDPNYSILKGLHCLE